LSRCHEIIREHLSNSHVAAGDQGWEYRQNLMTTFDFSDDFWRDVPGTIPIFVDGTLTARSLIEMAELDFAIVVSNDRRPSKVVLDTSLDVARQNSKGGMPTMAHQHLDSLGYRYPRLPWWRRSVGACKQAGEFTVLTFERVPAHLIRGDLYIPLLDPP